MWILGNDSLLDEVVRIKDMFYWQVKKITILSFVFWTLCLEQTIAQLRISEVMHGNMNIVYDSNNGNPESWIELYNPTENTILSGNYRLGRDSQYEKAFKLHNIYGVLPGCYVVVTCDENRGNVEMTLDPEGGSLYLFDEHGKIIDSLSYPKMFKPDVSWGQEKDGEEWGMMLRPTPGKSNTEIADVLPKKVDFSAQGGVWEHFDPFYVELTAKDVPDYYSEQRDVDTSLCIRYTLDGSEPTDSSKIYTDPIYVSTTTVIRAKVFDATRPLIASNSVSYIYHGRPVDKNVVSIITDSLYYYGEQEGIMGNRTLAALDFRRPMNFEYFALNECDDVKSLNLLCKGRAGGNTGRFYDDYINLVLYAKKRYGEKHFKNVFWPHLKPTIKENKSIYLRCGTKKACFMRDVLSLNMASWFNNIDYQATDALSVYLNGKYYGILYMFERTSDDYVWANYNKLDNIDLISIEDAPKVKSGTIDEFNKFVDFWQTSPHKLEEWQKWMDVEEYTNVQALEIFSGNRDFWRNNTRMYKSREDSTSVWRWIATDFDESFVHFRDDSYLEWAMNGDSTLHKSDDYGTRLWRSILKCDEYKAFFLDKIIAYHGDFLNKKSYSACVDSIFNLVSPEIILTKQIYNNGGDGIAHRDYLLECVNKRSDNFHIDLQSYFGLGKAVNVKVKNVAENAAELYYNGTKLKTNSFDGWDFAGRILSIQAKTKDYIKPCTWIVEKCTRDKVETELYSNVDLLTYIVPSNIESIVFTPVFTMEDNTVKEIESLTDILLLKPGSLIIIWDLYGRQLYCSEKNTDLILPKDIPLIISVDGTIKKIVFSNQGLH